MTGKVWSCSLYNPKFFPRGPAYKREYHCLEGARWYRSLHPVHGKKPLHKGLCCIAPDDGDGEEVHLVSQEELSDGSTLFVFGDESGRDDQQGEFQGETTDDPQKDEKKEEEEKEQEEEIEEAQTTDSCTKETSSSVSEIPNGHEEIHRSLPDTHQSRLMKSLSHALEETAGHVQSVGSHENSSAGDHNWKSGTLQLWKVTELKQKCKDLGMKGYSKMRKHELVDALLEWSE